MNKLLKMTHGKNGVPELDTVRVMTVQSKKAYVIFTVSTGSPQIINIVGIQYPYTVDPRDN